MSRIAKNYVYSALNLAKTHILEAAGRDGRTSHQDISRKAKELKGPEKELVQHMFQVADGFDTRRAQVTTADIDKAFQHARRDCIDQYDRDNNGLSTQEIGQMDKTGRYAVSLAKKLKASTEQNPVGKDGIDLETRSRLVENAISSYNPPYAFQPNPLLSRRIQPDQLPAGARRGVARAAHKILHRMDHMQRRDPKIWGYYAIYATPEKAEPVAYAVWGGGSADHFYMEANLAGVSPDGKPCFFDGRPFSRLSQKDG